MKTTNIRFTVLIAIIASTLFLSFCKKIKNAANGSSEKNLPKVEIIGMNEIGESSALIDAKVTDPGTGPLTAVGVCWSTNAVPDLSNEKVIVATNTGQFQIALSQLSHSTTYHIRGYATNEAGTAFSEERIFTTKEPPPPYLGKYLNGTGAYLEFLAGGEVRFGASGYVSGTYTMLSATRVQINIGNFGEGEFYDAFKKINTSVGQFNK